VNQRPILLILGNQLFPTSFLEQTGVKQVVMIEDRFLCEHFVYHQQKLVLVLAAMRAYAQQLQEQGFELTYIPLDENGHGPQCRGFLENRRGCCVFAECYRASAF
jgi:deoxyribodipyrimidine photolyase-like uncharacterized protein